MKRASFVFAAALTLLLAACSKTNPMLEQHPEYVGEWHSAHDSLKIEKTGQVTFKHKEQQQQQTPDSKLNISERSDVKATITRFDNHSFEIGQGEMGKDFQINQMPYKENGQWKMQLDGQVYTKK